MNVAARDLQMRIAELVRADRGRLLAALIAALRDFTLAEDCLQDALEAAVMHWGRSGLPHNPQGWLLRVARRKAIDRLRRDRNFQRKSAEIAVLMEEDSTVQDAPEIADERLRLIFTCCHPALDRKSRVALTLRMLGGLTTAEIARAFVDSEVAIGQRISRAKARITKAGISFKAPSPEDWSERLQSVLDVIYLIFNEGYSSSEDDAAIRVGLCEEAIWLGRLMDHLRPLEAEIEGLLALMLLTHARRAARYGVDGLPRPPERQDRTMWDSEMRQEGGDLLDRAVARLQAGPFQIQAAISALHMEVKPEQAVDWRQILLLYDRLYQMMPSPVVALNRAVALAEIAGPEAGLAGLAGLEGELARYQPYHAACGDLLARAGQLDAATQAWEMAVELSVNPADQAWLQARIEGLTKR